MHKLKVCGTTHIRTVRRLGFASFTNTEMLLKLTPMVSLFLYTYRPAGAKELWVSLFLYTYRPAGAKELWVLSLL